ncbi:MAG: hypothetical protein HDS23_06290 [Bacteroides sp.]|nr:hypothetical protein [Bacteroidales bacterium]MBD5292837.1 hypothetical protein [Bacteroides sp.]MBD5337645.1 hypothetical protein [Bacteroides sp.]
MESLKEQIRLLGADEAIALLDKWIAEHPEDVEAYTLRGMKHFGAGHRSAAIGDYLTALRLDPDNARARQALDYANSILDYYNKDLYNP